MQREGHLSDQFTFRAPGGFRDRLEEAAFNDNRTISDYLRKIVEERVDHDLRKSAARRK